MEALEEKYGSPIRIFPVLVRKSIERHSMDYTEEGLAHLRKQYYNTLKDMRELGCDLLSQYFAALACENFSPRLLEEWTKHTASYTKVPDMEDLMAYAKPLEHRLSCMRKTPLSSSSAKSTNYANRVNTSGHSPSSAKSTCTLCHEVHRLSRCPVFLGYDASRKRKYLRSRKGCFNCLNLGHFNTQCPSSFNCKKCNGRHHTSLHTEDNSSEAATPAQPSLVSASQPTNCKKCNGRHHTSLHTENNSSEAATPAQPSSQPTKYKNMSETPPTLAFLHTAMVKAVNRDRDCSARVAFDSGSASSLITETLATQLKLKRHHQRLNLSGAYGEGTSIHFVTVTLNSLHDPDQSITLKLSVIPRLPHAFPPNRKEEIAAVPHLQDLQLADPSFGGPLDILVGSLDYGRCIRGSLSYNLASNIAAYPPSSVGLSLGLWITSLRHLPH